MKTPSGSDRVPLDDARIEIDAPALGDIHARAVVWPVAEDEIK
jgi:hypothetical protein